jgi:hypothetical protein
MFTNGKWARTVLQDVLYVLDLYGNLLSVSHLTHRGAEVCFIGEHCHVYDTRKSLILEGALRNDLYVMCIQVDGLLTAWLAVLDSQLSDASLPPACALSTHLTSLTSSLDLQYGTATLVTSAPPPSPAWRMRTS